MRIYLVRHGQSVWNAEQRITGQSDVELSARGRSQALGLVSCFRGRPLAGVLCSPLRRAVDTARGVAEQQGVGLELDPDLMEVSLGVLEGRQRNAADPEAQALWARWRTSLGAEPPPRGESFDQLRARVEPCLHRHLSRARAEPLLIVAHRNVLRVAGMMLWGLSLERAFAWRVRSRYLYEVDCAVIPEQSVVRRISLEPDSLGVILPGFGD